MERQYVLEEREGENELCFPQVPALCPGVLHLLNTRARFAGGW